jgi:imidazolonepropionase-like amidohydrolase
MKKNINFIALMCLAFQLAGQTSNIPAPPQTEPFVLRGATAHIGNGTVIQNAVIAFDQGKITAIGTEATTVVPATYTSIDVTGKHIYPGFILPTTNMGLVEVGSVRATVDGSETGDYNPNIRAIIAYNTDSELPPTMRFNGILLAQITPTGGVISGKSSVVQLDAWNWEDAAVKTDEGIHLFWPNKVSNPRWWLGETQGSKNERYEPTIKELGLLLKDASVYGQSKGEKVNLKLQAMQGLFDGSITLYIHTNIASSIIESITLAKAHGIKKIALVGGAEALMVVDFLKTHEIPVILADVHALPGKDHDDTVMPYKLPSELYREGITFSFGFGGSMTARARNIPFYAGTAVAYGLPYEEAIKALTLNPARIMQIDSFTGTLEVGKEATFFVSSGDALDMRTNQMEHVFIQGRQPQLEATQQALYKKYSEKYGHKIND